LNKKDREFMGKIKENIRQNLIFLLLNKGLLYSQKMP
jgi:hypothetical protein